VLLSALVLLGSLSAPVAASDHLDGPATTQHRVTDLTDLYAFPTPDRPGFLTIILDAYPAVAPNGHFSDKVDYTIHLRRAAIRSGDHSGFDTQDEVAIHCSFGTPDDDAAHTATCQTEGGLRVTVGTNQVSPSPISQGGAVAPLRLYAGHRSDPFFFNAVFAAAYAQKGRLVAPLDQDLLQGLNTLSVVLEVNVGELYPGAPPALLALAAESTTRDSATGPIRHLDRIGRPEISNVTLVAHGDEADVRDAYNAEAPFAVSAEHAQAYRERIDKNIGFFDAIDHHTDWTDAQRRSLAELLVDDFLIVDLSRPCDGPGFFEIERSLLAHREHQTCGGRKPSEDVMDALFGLYTGGLEGRPTRDGVDRPSRALPGTFPWLAEPDVSDPARIKTFITNSLLERSE
jgi:hypothetical protein